MSSLFTNSFNNPMNLGQESQFSYMLRCHVISRVWCKYTDHNYDGDHDQERKPRLQKPTNTATKKTNIVITRHILSYSYHMVITLHMVITHRVISHDYGISHVSHEPHITWLPHITKYNMISKHHTISLKLCSLTIHIFLKYWHG